MITTPAEGGWIDAHVHIRDFQCLDAVAAAGVAALRDAGTREGTGLGHGMPGERQGLPTVVSAGRALYKRGGYGSLLGVPVDDRGEIKTEIVRLKNAGAGIIKVIASGMVSLTEPGRISPGGFDREELRFIAEEAGSLSLGVMAHANGEQAIMDAAHAGVQSIEHGFFMTEQALDVMARQGTFWVPTVGALERAADANTISHEMKASLAKLIQYHLKMIGRAHSMGVRLAIGTDCVLPDPDYTISYEAELSYFEQAGISPAEVMKIACEGGATLLGI